MLLGPVSDRIEVTTFMNGVKVYEGLQRLFGGLIPDLPEYTHIHGTHQLLS